MRRLPRLLLRAYDPEVDERHNLAWNHLQTALAFEPSVDLRSPDNLASAFVGQRELQIHRNRIVCLEQFAQSSER